MSTNTLPITITNQSGVIPLDVMADAQLIAEHIAAGKSVPADVVHRVHQRAERIRQEVLKKHGILDIGVPAIRELRGELPQP